MLEVGFKTAFVWRITSNWQLSQLFVYRSVKPKILTWLAGSGLRN